MLFVATASRAQADMIVVNASDYPLGTDLSTMFTGLTMSRLSQTTGATYNPTISGVHTVIDYPIPVPSFGGTFGLSEFLACSAAGGQPSIGCLDGYNVLEFTLAAPTDFFEIDGYFFTDPNFLVAFDEQGNIVPFFSRTYESGIGGTTRSILTASRERASITRIVYGAYSATTVTPTRIRYNVAEPATLALVGLGVAGALLRRRKA